MFSLGQFDARVFTPDDAAVFPQVSNVFMWMFFFDILPGAVVELKFPQ